MADNSQSPLKTEFPLWQAPLPFQLIGAELSGKITALGGLGLIRVAEYYHLDDLERETNAYKRHAPRPAYCFAHRLPQVQWGEALPNAAIKNVHSRFNRTIDQTHSASFNELLDYALEQDPLIIGFLHGLPDREVVEKIREMRIPTFAVAHSVLEALVADEFHIDIIVLQGLEAGGERAFFTNDLPHQPQPALSLLQQVRPLVKKELVLWGDFTEGADVIAALVSGATAVMLDRPFVACAEAGLPEVDRQRVIHANETESTISVAYTARPLRCLRDDFSVAGAERAEALYSQLHKKPLAVALSPIRDPENVEKLIKRLIDDMNYRVED